MCKMRKRDATNVIGEHTKCQQIKKVKKLKFCIKIEPRKMGISNRIILKVERNFQKLKSNLIKEKTQS